MNISVVIATYRRPKDLERCLKALQHQTRPADQVVLVVRDPDTEKFLAAFNPDLLPLHVVRKEDTGGIVAAMNAGLEAAKEDIIAFTDDDAAPHPDWLARIENHFLWQMSSIGGVGGRDYGCTTIHN
jgi:glycosyltransferase involved in cell wall biosynthesis